jgi:hypothetical protein
MRETQNPSPNCDEKNPSTIHSAGKDSEHSDCNIRTVRHDRNFVQIENSTAQDSRLSWAARGLLLYLLSLPADWQVRVSHLIEQGDSGRDGVRRMLRELQTFGYASGFGKAEDRGDSGRFGSQPIVIYESPALNPFFLANSPTPEKPSPVTPTPEKPSPYKEQNLQKTDLQNTQQHTAGVCVSDNSASKTSGSRFSLAECQAYARHLHETSAGITNPSGFAISIHRTGQQDAQLEQFLNPSQIAPAGDRAPATAPLANPDPTCSLCWGSGREYVLDDAGRVLGVKPTPCSCRQPERARAQQAALIAASAA